MKLRQEISNLTLWQWIGAIVLFASIVAFRISWVITLPVTHDEASTFINFSSRGLFYAMAYYPAPNNHVLHSIFTWVFHYLPFDALTNIRIPSMLVGLVAIFVLYFILVKAEFQKGLAVFLTAIFAFGFEETQYGIQARGYSFVLLFSSMLVYAAMALLKSNESIKKHIAPVFIFSAIAGSYSIPTFIYVLASVMVYLTLVLLYDGQFDKLRKVFLWNIFIGVVVYILYLPVVLISGLDVLVNNDYVKSIPRAEVFQHLFAHLESTLALAFNISSTIYLVIGLMVIYLFF